MVNDVPLDPQETSSSDAKLNKVDYKKKYDLMIKKYNNLCEIIDKAGYELMSIGKLNRIKDGQNNQ